ncbi:hypothetical protein V8E52_002608 [Russula decolorans]|jgi:hypothetical protein
MYYIRHFVHNEGNVDARRGNVANTSNTSNVSLQHPFLPQMSLMSSPAPPTVVNDAGPDPAPPLRLVGSITYDREEAGYNLEWETRADFAAPVVDPPTPLPPPASLPLPAPLHTSHPPYTYNLLMS